MTNLKRKHATAWYNGSHYKTNQPFATFLTCHGEMIQQNLNRILEKIQTLVPLIEESTALEIGPGLAPVITYLPFQESYLVEQSNGIVETLSKRNKRKNIHFVVGDISHLPPSIPTPVDIIVMNEVLTHVRPKQRINIVKKLAAMSQSLVIVERPRVPYEKFLQTLYPLIEGSRTPQQQRDIYATYTDVQPLTTTLREWGWVVKTTNVVSGETYSIITAKRKRKA